MKACARILGWALLGLMILGSVVEPGRLLGHGDVCQLFPDAGPEMCCPNSIHPPVVAVKVRVPAHSPPGKEIVYKICVENCSAAEAHHVIVRNPLPANAKFVKADPPPIQQDGELFWKFGTIGGGACREIELVLLPTNKEDVKNCTRVQFEHGQCVTTRQSAYPHGVCPDGLPPVITPEVQAQLKLTIDGPAKQYVNLPARYFVTVKNEGNAPATNLLVTTSLPEKSKFVKASDDGRFALKQVAWVLGTLAPGASRTVEVEMRALAAGELCLVATALADRGVTAKPVEFCTKFGGESAVLLEMIDTKDPIGIGEETSYKIIIQNQGAGPITNVQVRVAVSPLLSFTLAKAPVGHKLGELTPQGQVILFDTIPSIEADGQATLEVYAKGLKAGDARFAVTITADQLKQGGPVAESESTTIYQEDEGVRGRVLSLRKKAE